jgi:integrase
MPRHPEPFYRNARHGWFVQVGKRQIKLGRDPSPQRNKEGVPVAPAPILKKYHEVMATLEEEKPPEPPPVNPTFAVEVIDTFLDWVERHKAPRTYEWYVRHCQLFSESIGKDMAVAELRPRHLTELCDAHPEWMPNSKHALCRAVQRAFRWAAEQGYIDRSPLAKVEKPQPEERDELVTPEEYAAIMAVVKEPNFRALLEMAWESGMRPQELRLVEAKHVDAKHGRLVFPPKDAKGKKLPRVVYLTDEALAIAVRHAEQNPKGPIFRNSDGLPWHRWSINCAFIRVQIAFGRQIMKEKGIAVPKLPRFRKFRIEPAKRAAAKAEHDELVRGKRKEIKRLALEHGQKFHLGAFRKSFATEALKNGVDPITASHLLGHKDTAMLSRVYARLAQDPEYLRGAAKRVRGGDV